MIQTLKDKYVKCHEAICDYIANKVSLAMGAVTLR